MTLLHYEGIWISLVEIDFLLNRDFVYLNLPIFIIVDFPSWKHNKCDMIYFLKIRVMHILGYMYAPVLNNQVHVYNFVCQYVCLFVCLTDVKLL